MRAQKLPSKTLFQAAATAAAAIFISFSVRTFPTSELSLHYGAVADLWAIISFLMHQVDADASKTVSERERD